MIEIQNTGSLFYLSQNEHEAVVVTTNGVIRKNGDAELIEGNTWGDRIWGVCDGVGENRLGKILMRVRAEM